MPIDPGRRDLLAGGLAALATPALAGEDDLDAFVRDQMRTAGIPGLGLAAARDGVVRLARGYGFADLARRRPATARTPFHIASITKTVTATAVMQLVERGRLDLDAPVAPHLDFRFANPRHPAAPVTTRHLLNHTSGLSDARYYEIDFRQRGRDVTTPLETFVRDYLAGGESFSDAPPGATWDYSNVGYAVLGCMVRRICGLDLREQTRRTIFAPLGLRETRWTLAGAPMAATPYEMVENRLMPIEPLASPDYPGSMIRASAADLGAYVAAQSNGGGPLLGKAAQAQMLEMATPAGLPAWLTGQGLGWQASKLDGKVRPNHWGGDPGVFTAAYLDPDSRCGAVILTNLTATDASKAAVKAIAARLLTY